MKLRERSVMSGQVVVWYVVSVVAAEKWSAAFTPLPRGLFPMANRKLPSAAKVRTPKRPEGRAPRPILMRALHRSVVWLVLLASTVRLAVGETLVWQQNDGYRKARLNVPATGKSGFTLVPPEVSGIYWTNRLSARRVAKRHNLISGAGVALGDVDGDGWCDIYLCNLEGENALCRNLGGWKFENVASRAAVGCTNQSSTGAVFADVNGDGRLDLLVNSFTGPNACLLNLGQLGFSNVTQAAGLLSKGGSTSMALGDIDGDGDLDLYVTYFGVEAILRDGERPGVRTVDGQLVITGRHSRRLKIIEGKIVEFGEPDILYRNDGQGRFTALDWKHVFQDERGRSMDAPFDFGLAVQMRDINADGHTDIYVCNDFYTPDRVWLNDGHGHFRAIERLALRNMSYASMGVDFADVDRDGRLDFYVVEMLSRDHTQQLRQASSMDPIRRRVGAIDDREEFARNTLYWNRGDGTYAEIGFYSGLAASDWSWTPVFIDVDLDGYEDVLVTNGHLYDVNDRDAQAIQTTRLERPFREAQRDLDRYPPLATPHAAFHNRGDLTFEDASGPWGFDSRRISHGMALADLDNDGDLDVVINSLNAQPLIYRNNSVAPRLAVRLKGKQPNRFGIGAKIEVMSGPVPAQFQEMLCGGRYLSGDDTIRVFAAGSPTNKLLIKVTWRSGKQSVIAGAEPNFLYEVDEASSKPPAKTDREPQAKNHEALFEDVSQRLGHVHREDSFDDFARQPLLPLKLSQLGPGVAWYDLDDDGHDDLIIGSGKGGMLAVYRNSGNGTFTPWSDPVWSKPAPDDQTAVVGWRSEDGGSRLVLGLATYESPSAHAPGLDVLMVRHTNVALATPLAGAPSSTGPIDVADIDDDGDLDVLVGGRVVPGRYPEAASSRIFRSDGGQLSLDSVNTDRLAGVGLVSGAVFSDLDGDGRPELILACEWGPLRVFTFRRGVLHELTRDLGLDQHIGIWTGVTTGDLDGDGRMDLVAGNRGLNSFYNRAPAGPWFLYFGDFNRDGQEHLLEAYPDGDLGKTVPWRDLDVVGGALPWLRERFPTHAAYAAASVTEILRERFDRTHELKVNTLNSMVFLNRPGAFEAVPMPPQAQWSPVFGVSVTDVDGDGNEDVFLSQNLFAVRPEDNRLDAGRGLVLRGDGRGRLVPLSGKESGIKAYGEQRGCAFGDFDEDGRTDLVLTQNGAETKLYRNVGATAGLRVRLIGTTGNPSAIGAQMRLLFGQRPGPVREVRAGGGYWSQDSPVQVLGTPEPPTRIWIRWPGGQITIVEVPRESREVSVDQAGEVRLLKTAN